MRKRFLALICILAILSCSFFGCAKDVEDFTEEEHIYRISKRIKNSDRKFAFSEGETYRFRNLSNVRPKR